MAAGFDKNGLAWPAAAALGFGHVEIGSVTARPQPGNPSPRVFRYPREEAVINRLGFNNEGAKAVAARLMRQPGRGRREIPLGINLGKSKAADIDQAAQDYLASFGQLADLADYLVLNVSSPNTPGLRQLQDEVRLRDLVGVITAANRLRAGRPGGARLPILLKIAPDLNFHQIDAVLGVISEFGLEGIIATNTTLARPGLFAALGETRREASAAGPSVGARPRSSIMSRGPRAAACRSSGWAASPMPRERGRSSMPARPSCRFTPA